MWYRCPNVQKLASFAALPKSFVGRKEPWCSRVGLEPVVPFDPYVQTASAELVLALTYSFSAPLRCTTQLSHVRAERRDGDGDEEAEAEEREDEDLSRFVLMQSTPEDMRVCSFFSPILFHFPLRYF